MVRLSQCMIVKNEEKNIEKAMAWAKDIAFEQIVVDTGSTDRTFELAERLGADVYHFEWIDDFSAAKNFAIEKATGDWIAFLDADEYLTTDNVKRLSNLLEEVESGQGSKDTHAISCLIVNINDSGKPMTRFSSVRVFRNLPSTRFKGSIHEQPTINASNIIDADYIQIIHTGYSESARNESDKGERNINLLRKELKANPNNLNLKLYLANSLSMSNDTKDQNEAEQLYLKVLNSKKTENVHSILRVKMYIFMITKYLYDPDKLQECKEMCHLALKEMPESVDFLYFLALTLSKMGKNDEAWEVLKSCEEKLVNGSDSEDSLMIPADPTILFGQMILAAKNLNDIENVILYSIHVLTMDRTRTSILGPCIATMVYYGASNIEIIELLSNVYDMNNHEDAKFVATTAEEFGAVNFASFVSDLPEDVK